MRIYTTQTFQWTDQALDVILAAMKTNPAAALFPTLKLRLGKTENFVVTPTTTKADADAQQADFTDYVEVSVTLSDPVNLSANADGVTVSGTFTMTTSPPVTTNTVWNYYLISGTILLGGEKFAGGASISMALTGDFATINVQLPLRFEQAVA